MRSNRTVVILACLLVAAGLVGCARAGDKVLVFGTDTKVALDLSSGSPTKEPSITLGYSRHEAVWLPLIADTGNFLTYRCLTTGEDGKLVCTDTVPATHKCAVSLGDTPPNATFEGTQMVCLSSGTLTTKFVGRTDSKAEDAYSVIASFGLDSSGNRATIAQYMATGIAARELARRGGASLVNPEAVPLPASVLELLEQERDYIDLVVAYVTKGNKVDTDKFDRIVDKTKMQEARKNFLKGQIKDKSPDELHRILSEPRYNLFLREMVEAINSKQEEE